jgi:hypothetical protein
MHAQTYLLCKFSKIKTTIYGLYKERDATLYFFEEYKFNPYIIITCTFLSFCQKLYSFVV